GTAAVKVEDFSTPAGVTTSGTFLPSAGIFVSVDGKNSGIGFGSSGLLPQDPNFPAQIQPIYPFALAAVSGLSTYTLKTDIDTQGYFALSCVDGIINSCHAPKPLATTAGDLTIATAEICGFPARFTASVSRFLLLGTALTPSTVGSGTPSSAT